MKIRTALNGAPAAALLLCSAAANAFVIDFEGFAAGTIIDTEYAASPGPGVTISATNFNAGPDVAVVFDTNNPTGGDTDLAAPFSSLNPLLDQTFTPGNVLIIQERNNCDFAAGTCSVPDDEGRRPGGEIEFLFSAPVVLQTLDFFDIELAEDNNNPNSQVRLFDANNVEISPGAFFVPNTGGDNTWNQLQFGNVAGVSRVVVELNGSGAIDNLAYVPIPAALWLFGSALGGLIWLGRKQTG